MWRVFHEAHLIANAFAFTAHRDVFLGGTRVCAQRTLATVRLVVGAADGLGVRKTTNVVACILTQSRGKDGGEGDGLDCMFVRRMKEMTCFAPENTFCSFDYF
jgi:hypothetical protein